MTIKRFVQMEYELLRATGFVDKKTGDFVKLIANDKLLYCYIRARVKYFVDERKGEYFDTQEAIAEALHMDVKSARKSLQKFLDAGILKAEKKKFHNYMNWRYSKVEVLTLWVKDDDDKPEIIKVEQSEPETKPQQQQQAPKQQPAWADPGYDPFDEPDLPF